VLCDSGAGAMSSGDCSVCERRLVFIRHRDRRLRGWTGICWECHRRPLQLLHTWTGPAPPRPDPQGHHHVRPGRRTLVFPARLDHSSLVGPRRRPMEATNRLRGNRLGGHQKSEFQQFAMNPPRAPARVWVQPGAQPQALFHAVSVSGQPPARGTAATKGSTGRRSVSGERQETCARSVS
jgi:hypothetical protein